MCFWSYRKLHACFRSRYYPVVPEVSYQVQHAQTSWNAKRSRELRYTAYCMTETINNFYNVVERKKMDEKIKAVLQRDSVALNV